MATLVIAPKKFGQKLFTLFPDKAYSPQPLYSPCEPLSFDKLHTDEFQQGFGGTSKAAVALK